MKGRPDKTATDEQVLLSSPVSSLAAAVAAAAAAAAGAEAEAAVSVSAVGFPCVTLWATRRDAADARSSGNNAINCDGVAPTTQHETNGT